MVGVARGVDIEWVVMKITEFYPVKLEEVRSLYGHRVFEHPLIRRCIFLADEFHVMCVCRLLKKKMFKEELESQWPSPDKVGCACQHSGFVPSGFQRRGGQESLVSNIRACIKFYLLDV